MYVIQVLSEGLHMYVIPPPPMVEEVVWAPEWVWKGTKKSKSILFYIIQLEPRILR
jgi:hypothetical protein